MALSEFERQARKAFLEELKGDFATGAERAIDVLSKSTPKDRKFFSARQRRWFFANRGGSGAYRRGKDLSATLSDQKFVEIAQNSDLGSDWQKTMSESWKSDPTLGQIMQLQGFHGKPQVVTTEEMDNLTHKNLTEVFRGISGSEGSKKTYTEQYRTGEHYVGIGIYGNGTYTSNMKKTAHEYAGNVNPQSNDGILRMAIKKEARVIDYDTVEHERKKGIEKIHQEADEKQIEIDRRSVIALQAGDENAFNQIRNEASSVNMVRVAKMNVYRDTGRYAALKGYDVITQRQGQSDETFFVILNRTAMIVEEARP